jgi:hypothetical protein
MNLLIHSMSEFGDIIVGGLEIAGARHLVEIGAEFGGTSGLLADYAATHEGSLTSVDPSAQPAFAQWLAQNPHVRHVEQPSLEVIESMSAVDAWIIDGDHNYYTVFHELTAIDAVCQRDGRPLLAFMHDVAWPCGRRDSYYCPDRIPAEWLHPHDFDGGVSLAWEGLRPQGGFRGCGQFAWALHEGGPRNGVLTAIEDFIDGYRESGRGMGFAFVPAVFGLGVLFDTSAPWAPAFAEAIIPWHENALLATLERNRLMNYLRVIELQDEAAAARIAA